MAGACLYVEQGGVFADRPCALTPQRRWRKSWSTSLSFIEGGTVRPDKKKIAALALLTTGRATVSEVARLAGTSRQRVQHWVKYGIEHKGPPWPRNYKPPVALDVQAARAEWLAKQWEAEMGALGVEDREDEREWDAALKRVRRRLSSKSVP
jgi:transposase-like protein